MDTMPADSPKQGAVERFTLFESFLPNTMLVVIVANADFRHDALWLSCCTEEIVFGYKVRRFRSASRHYVIPEPETERQFLDQFNQSDLEWSFIDWYPYRAEGNA